MGVGSLFFLCVHIVAADTARKLTMGYVCGCWLAVTPLFGQHSLQFVTALPVIETVLFGCP